MKLLKKLFTKVDQKISTITMSNAQIIEQIHNEFNGAGEQLLKEANEILGNLNFTTEKAEALKRVGFTSTPEVIDIERKIETKKHSEQLVRLVQEYRLHYPNQKFITKEMVDKICKKYNLVCGPVSLYKGFVPKSNLKQIEAFCLKEIHCKYGIPFTGWRGNSVMYRTKQEYEEQEKDLQDVISPGIFIRMIRHENRIKIIKESLLICAPIKDMDTTNMILNGNWLEIKIPDPVVLQPVKGGFLILTAWGEEASDPLVVNEILN